MRQFHRLLHRKRASCVSERRVAVVVAVLWTIQGCLQYPHIIVGFPAESDSLTSRCLPPEEERPKRVHLIIHLHPYNSSIDILHM